MGLIWHTQMTAIDALALLTITAALVLVRRPFACAVPLLVSVSVNEKVALVLAVWLSLRVVLVPADRALMLRPAAAAVGAVCVCALTVLILHLPGNACQLMPSGYLDTIRQNLAAYATSRGVLLNILPPAVLAAISVAGHLTTRSGLFRRADLLVIPAMLGVARIPTQFYQAGRLVMHAAPLFVMCALATVQAFGASERRR